MRASACCTCCKKAAFIWAKVSVSIRPDTLSRYSSCMALRRRSTSVCSRRRSSLRACTRRRAGVSVSGSSTCCGSNQLAAYSRIRSSTRSCRASRLVQVLFEQRSGARWWVRQRRYRRRAPSVRTLPLPVCSMTAPQHPQTTSRARGWTWPPAPLRARPCSICWTVSKVSRSMIGSWVPGTTIH